MERRRKHGKHSLYEPKSELVDHFSLKSPSDTIRFHRTAVCVYSSSMQQFQIIEDGNKNIFKAKVTSDGSSGLSLMRASYTLVMVLMMGFLLIFCLQVLLFLFVSLIMEGGLTSKQRLSVFYLLGTLFSIPIFSYGLGSVLTMATEFVHDTWQGHFFFQSVLCWNAVSVDWVSFALFLGIPLAVMLSHMFTNKHCSETTALTWFGCVTAAFCLFCFAVFVFEIWGALELFSHHPKYGLQGTSALNIGRFLKQAILLQQMHRFARVRRCTFYMDGSQELPNPNDSYDASELANHEHMREEVSWYSKWMVWLAPNWMFADYNMPCRQYNVEDILDWMIFVTDSSWSLEKLFCHRKAARTIVVVHGPSRITTAQVISSMACAILGNLLMLLAFAAFLRWMLGLSVLVILVVVALVLRMNREAFH